MSDITKTQYSLAVKAEHNKQHRFERKKSKISSPSVEPVTRKYRLSVAQVAK